ncbi:MAG: 4Fe-4S dicluster domain-containing protein [Deltaproteobacteria bacterium]|nr:4Fe-4S dicluster domain-containing protein [Deltaproteobacteria bacterium]
MRSDPEKCIGCELCRIYCPVDVIHTKPRSPDMPGKGKYYVVIDEEGCVECRCCVRADVCKSGALYQPEMQWPRTIRAAFSDPSITFAETGVPGRGTEEMKTNEVTGRYKRGMVGIATEMGRPGVGARLRDLEKMAMALAGIGARFEPKNPVTAVLMEDTRTGKLKPDVLNEKVLSAIIEAEVPLEKFRKALEAIREVGKNLESVFSLDVICPPEADGIIPVLPIIAREGLEVRINGKTNLGLGRHTNKQEER